MLYTTQIKSRQPAVTCVVAEVESQLASNGVGIDQSSEVCLVLAEALNNVVEHAYSYAEDGDIDIVVSLERRNLLIQINDFGPEFAPPKPKEAVDHSQERFDDLPEGGFGWSLIQMLTDEITLSRIDDRNHLELRKELGGGTS